jgi:hypothetical protein
MVARVRALVGVSDAVGAVSPVGVGVRVGFVIRVWVVAWGRLARCVRDAGLSCGGHPTCGGETEPEPGQAGEVVCGSE